MTLSLSFYLLTICSFFSVRVRTGQGLITHYVTSSLSNLGSRCGTYSCFLMGLFY